MSACFKLAAQETRYRSKQLLANAIAEGITDGYEVRFLTSYKLNTNVFG